MMKCLFSMFVLSILCLPQAHSQNAAQDAGRQDKADGKAEATVDLSLPEDMELKVLVELVNRQLGINFLYDDQINGKRITIKSVSKIPKSSLMGLLESSLRMKGLAIVDGKQKGWKRIIQATNLTDFAKPTDGRGQADAGATAAVTRIFSLKHADTKRVSQVIQPFLTQPGANTVEISEHGLLIVTEYVSNIKRVEELIKLADQPLRNVSMKFIAIKHVDAGAIGQQVVQAIQAKDRAQGSNAAAGGSGAGGLTVSADARTNQLLLIGTEEKVAQSLKIIETLDVKLDVRTQIYQLGNANPERIDRLARELIGQDVTSRRYKSAIDREGGLLIVTASQDVHTTVAKLVSDLDVPVSESQSRMRFYKLTNATASEVLETISLLDGENDRPAPANGFNGNTNGTFQPNPSQGITNVPSITPATGRQPNGVNGRESYGTLRPLQRTVQTQQATVVADVNTNTLIVVGDPETHKMYEQLIRQLDRRRPQVLIEATIVAMDTTNGFSLGVELARSTSAGGNNEVVTFSSFGLSTIEELGRLSPIPGAGFNGALISSDIADVVIRALASNTRARVVSAPRILVNDNATGTLSSVAEEPFTSVNASDTVATTSFAGFVSAGTDITVTPHIAEGDHLSLDFSVALNSFAGDGANGVPPPRQTNTVTSQVTIPDGNTIIVGGLSRSDHSKTRQSIPLLGDLPIIGPAFGNETDNQANTTLFVFLRPIILRDDKFVDLKYLSAEEAAHAELESDDPPSSPLVIR